MTLRENRDPLGTLEQLKALNDSLDLGTRTVRDKAVTAFSKRLTDIRAACHDIEAEWMKAPPHRIASEVAPFEESWALQMTRYQKCYEDIANAGHGEADNLVLSLALGDEIDKTGARLISLLDLPCALKTRRTLPANRPERNSEFAPSVRAALLAAAARPDPKPDEGQP